MTNTLIGKKFPDNFCTIDHLRSRLAKNRREPNLNLEIRTVLACWKCNGKRNDEEQKELPLIELHERAGCKKVDCSVCHGGRV